MKRLVSSQETYIKELEGKIQEMETTVASKDALNRDGMSGDWESEKAQLQNLVEKNQQIAEDLESKLRQREQEFQSELEQSKQTTHVESEYLRSENRVLKDLQDKKITSEKDRIQFHKTLRNMLLEEIERIEREQQAKEEEMEQW